jgi:hypothetical protein
MRRSIALLAAAILVVAFTLPAFAWEFEMKGVYENRFRYFGRTGTTDLFGESTLQEGQFQPVLGDAVGYVGFAGPRYYNLGDPAAAFMDSSNTGSGGSAAGHVIARGGFSTWGSEAFYNDSRLALEPTIRVNKAIRVHGVYNVGGMRHKYMQASMGTTYTNGDGPGVVPTERYYMSQTSMNAYDGTLATWEQFRATITFPFGIWSIGLKDFPFGLGASLGYNTRAEAFLMVVPYGPFRFLYGAWLGRGRFLESWNTVPDKDTKNDIFQGMLMTYDCGDLNIGAGAIYRFFHRNQGAQRHAVRAGVATAQQQAFDDSTWINLMYFKYFNGRFFANAEYAWLNLDRYPSNAQLGVATAAGSRLSVEAHHAFAEMGVTVGPLRTMLAWAWAPGNPLNDGNATKAYFPWAINYQAMEPYEWLMFNTYGGGNDGGWNAAHVTFVADDHGMMADAWALAARMDYAVASNLNVWASYIWAHRVETAGFFVGGKNCTGGVLAGATAATQVAAATSPVLAQYGGSTPFVPDGFLGNEFGAGVDWKLLEGLTMNFRYAWWQPGPWFDYAYRAVGVNPAGAVTGDCLIKGRDPIQAFEGKVVIEF